MKSFSVIILTYNTTYKRTILTIESVLRQKFNDYEIVIADDASEVDHFNEIQKYLEDKNFTDYLFIKNEKNLGTVKNIFNATKKAKGKYIKAIGSGDLLYDNNILYNMFSFLNINNYKFGFGKLSSFYLRDGKIIESSFTAPTDIDIYRSNKIPLKIILYNLINTQDWISSSTMFFEREYFIRYISELKGKVIYTDDLIQILMYMHNERLHYMDKYIIWYEQGAGISTGKSRKWKHAIEQDINNFFKYVKTKYGLDNEKIKKSESILKLINDIIKLFYLNDRKTSKTKKRNGFINEKDYMDFMYNFDEN